MWELQGVCARGCEGLKIHICFQCYTVHIFRVVLYNYRSIHGNFYHPEYMCTLPSHIMFSPKTLAYTMMSHLHVNNIHVDFLNN